MVLGRYPNPSRHRLGQYFPQRCERPNLIPNRGDAGIGTWPERALERGRWGDQPAFRGTNRRRAVLSIAEVAAPTCSPHCTSVDERAGKVARLLDIFSG